MTDHPEPDPGASEHTSLTPPVPPSADRSAGGQHNGYANGPPNKEDILHKLGQMPGLIAIGVLPPAKANAMKGVYQTILSHVDDSRQSGAARVADEDLIKILQQQPELLKALQPFLTPEQLDLIIREAPK
jgi:hypothetical protein